MSVAEFIRIIEAFRHCEQLNFHNCRISNFESEYEFQRDLDYSYKYISFEKWGRSITNDSFSFFLEAVDKTNMRDTLEEFNIHQWEADIDRVLEQLDAWGMNILVENSRISVIEAASKSAEKIFYE